MNLDNQISKAEFSAIGFKEFKYIKWNVPLSCKGCYIQATESIASETMENRTVFMLKSSLR